MEWFKEVERNGLLSIMNRCYEFEKNHEEYRRTKANAYSWYKHENCI